MHEKSSLQASGLGYSRVLAWAVLLILTSNCASEFDGLYTPGLIVSASSTPTATVVADPCVTTASPFGYGSGTVGNPYLICTRAHLAAIAGAYLSSYFKQTQNIDLGGVGTPWAPIAAVAFTGTYDGNSKTISNLYYNTAGVSDVGLFKLATTGAVIKNVILTGVNITATGTRTGALVARLTASTVLNCTVSGTVSGAGTAGGLVGLSETASAITSSSSSATVSGTLRVGGLVASITGDGTITSSSATGSVTGTNNMVGGLAGNVSGTAANNQISSSYATGTVSGTSGSYVGGLIGTIGSAGILNSYATGSVTGGGNGVGGLVGYSQTVQISTSHYAGGTVTGGAGAALIGGLVGWMNSTTILKSYSTGTVNATDAGVTGIGGLVGQSDSSTIQNSYSSASHAGIGDYSAGLVGSFNGSTLTNSFSTGLVIFSTTGGGLIADNDGSGTITNSYWDKTTSGQAASSGGTGLFTAQMIDYNNFTGWDFAAIWNGAGYSGSAAVYPYLR